MPTPAVQRLGHDILCLDADYIAPGLACFYLIRGGDEYAVIETGTAHSLALLQDCLREEGIEATQLRYVVPTHAHLDHAGGAGAIMAAFPDATLLAHPSAARHLIDPSRLVSSSIEVYGERAFARLYGEIQPIPGERVHTLEDRQQFEVGDRVLEARHTRGHANHHLCLWDATRRGWFTGDMFGVCYREFRLADGPFVAPSTTPTQFDPEAFIQSLDLLASYGPERLYLTHFGELGWEQSARELLQQQVMHYPELARQTGNDVGALSEALIEYTWAQLGSRVPDDQRARIAERIAADMNLNAQGLSIWLRRQAA